MFLNKKITIAIPVFNGEKYISEALQSVINQTKKVNQILISDNKSTDNTVKIVNQFIIKYPEIDIQLHQNDVNIGAVSNFNKCMKLCKTEYLLELAVDDKLKDIAIERLIGFYDQNPDFGVVLGNVDRIDEFGQIVEMSKKKETTVFKQGQILELIEKTGLWLQQSGALYNMELIKDIETRDEKYIGGDERFWAQILLRHPIALLGDSLVYERMHSEQLGKKEHLRFNDKIRHFEENIKVANYEHDSERRKKAKKMLKKWAATQCISVGRSVWKNHRKYWLAVRYWFYGIKQTPKIIGKYRFWKIIMYSLLFR